MIRLAAVRAVGWPLSTRSESQPADAIVVLGAPATQSGRVSAVCAERVTAAVSLWRNGAAPTVYMTGGSGRGGLVEADVMGAYAREVGLPEDALVLERRALNTEQNARFIAELLPPRSTVWLVTTPFHLRRSMYLFRRAGLRPLAWHIDDSLQFRNPRRAARWIAREYGAWGWLALRQLRERLR